MEHRESTASSNSNVLLSVEEILGLVTDSDDEHNSVDAIDEINPIRPLCVRSASASPSFVIPPPEQRRAQTWHAPNSPAMGNPQEQNKRSRSRPSNRSRSNTSNLRSSNTNSLCLRPQLVETNIAPFETSRSKNERKEVAFPSSPCHPYAAPKEKKAASRFEIFENKLREEDATSGLLW